MGVAGLDPSRSSLSDAAVRDALARLACAVPVSVLGSVASTNDVAISGFDGGWWAVTADEQVEGRGRLDRRWSSPYGAGIALSIAAPVDAICGPLVELPMRLGVAVVDALLDVGVHAALKWPNDVMVDERKCGGMLIQVDSRAVVLGVGINVDLAEHELPVPSATSLAIEGYAVQREPLIAAIVARVHDRLTDGSTVAADYRRKCATLGRDVMVTLVDGTTLAGRAVEVTDAGALVVESAGVKHSVSIGDVVHARLS